MKEHLLAIAFLGLLFLLYMAPMPESFLNKDFHIIDPIEEVQQNTQQRIKPTSPDSETNQQDTMRTNVVAATRL